MQGPLRVRTLSALVALMLAAGAAQAGNFIGIGPVFYSTGGRVHDSMAQPSFAPQIQFWSGGPEDTIQIGAGLAKSDLHYEVGEPVSLLLVIRNASGVTQYCSSEGPYSEYWESVTDGTGNPVPMTDFGRRRTENSRSHGHGWFAELAPYGSYTETLDLGTCFNMAAPGIYTITVTRGEPWSGIGPAVPPRSTQPHRVGPITIVVGPLPPESQVVLGSTLASGDLRVSWDAGAKMCTVTRRAAGAGWAPLSGASVTVSLPDAPTGAPPRLSQRVLSVITTFFGYTSSQVPAR